MFCLFSVCAQDSVLPILLELTSDFNPNILLNAHLSLVLLYKCFMKFLSKINFATHFQALTLRYFASVVGVISDLRVQRYGVFQ